MTGVLLKAVSAERPRQVRLLLDSGIAVETMDECGQTSLIRAVFLEHKSSREKIVRMLLKAGSRVSSSDLVGRNALGWACIYSRDREVKWMLDYSDLDLNLNQTDVNGQTALAHAAISGNAATVKLLVDALLKYGLSVEVPDQKGMTPLMHAIKLCHDICASILIHQGGATIGKNMKSPEDVDYAIQFWEDGCSHIDKHTRHFLNNTGASDTNNNKTANNFRVKPSKSLNQKMHIHRKSYFPPLLPEVCAKKIKYREERARRHQIQTPSESEEDDVLSAKDGSEASFLSDDSLDNCAPIQDQNVQLDWQNPGANLYRRAAGSSMSVLTCCETPESYRTASMTSSTEANADSSDEDDVDDRSRPVRDQTRFLKPSKDLHKLYRVYEQQKSPSYRPGAARPLNRPKDVRGSTDSFLDSSSDYGDPSRETCPGKKISPQGVLRRVPRKQLNRSKVSVHKRSADVSSSSDSDLSDKLFTPVRRGILPKISSNNYGFR